MWQRSAPQLTLALRCTRVALAPRQPSSSATGRGNSSSSGFGSGWALPKQIASWYPRKVGEFLANTIAGHNTFIQDIPTRFDEVHARHFSLVEGLTITPLYTLAIVHYFSIFCQYPTRVELLKPMLDELGRKSTLQCHWLLLMQTKRTPAEIIAWRCGLLTLQFVLFPIWLFLSSTAPQLVHATIAFSSHILHTKYGCLSSSGSSSAGGRAAAAAVVPEFVLKGADMYAAMQTFHETQSVTVPTDFGVAVVMLLLILVLTL
ncbi:hypothetical protein LPMP_160450 [Leishmania panamensis]|uniref:Uncharacterized protein n=1 Tax=Leishmania panamensis TaxID=5679 RepID=A0A088RNU2_LEIPA|nr:hypothetical protein LPMP_160450 [Leishmania panamensis]AIN96919.1 hypothetical protein LPMP_160450 [Leishmania panamensis]